MDSSFLKGLYEENPGRRLENQRGPHTVSLCSALEGVSSPNPSETSGERTQQCRSMHMCRPWRRSFCPSGETQRYHNQLFQMPKSHSITICVLHYYLLLVFCTFQFKYLTTWENKPGYKSPESGNWPVPQNLVWIWASRGSRACRPGLSGIIRKLEVDLWPPCIYTHEYTIDKQVYTHHTSH